MPHSVIRLDYRLEAEPPKTEWTGPPSLVTGDVYQAQGTGETFRFEDDRLLYSGLWFERFE